VAPVAIGVGVALAWNGAASLQADQSEGMSGVAPQVTLTVQQAAARTWVSAVTTEATGARAPGRGDGCHLRPAIGAGVQAAGTQRVVALAHRQPRRIGTADMWCAVRPGSRSGRLTATVVGR
jgi:hypothetical protein